MEILIVAVIIFIIFIILIQILNKQIHSKSKNLNDMPYKAKNLLTNNEYSFYIELRKAIEYNQIIFTKVVLRDFIQVNKNENYRSYQGKISQKHIDFLICSNDTKILYAIELDDKSHEKEERKGNDEFKNRLFKTIGIPLIRIKSSNIYKSEIITEEIDRQLKRNTAQTKSNELIQNQIS